MENKELKVGEKYLKIVETIGNVDFEFTAFPNKERTDSNKQPHYKGRNIAVWINTKKEKVEEESI